MEIVDISLGRMALLYLFLLIPVALMWKLDVPLIRRLAVSVGRMTLQLVLVGLYLRYLFEKNPSANTDADFRKLLPIRIEKAVIDAGAKGAV